MAVTWDIVALDATKTVGSLSDVVTTIHWYASDSETVGSGDSAKVITGSANGAISLAEADNTSFTAYKDITKDNAITWVKAALGSDAVAQVETHISSEIAEQKSPSKTSGVPW